MRKRRTVGEWQKRLAMTRVQGIGYITELYEAGRKKHWHFTLTYILAETYADLWIDGIHVSD